MRTVLLIGIGTGNPEHLTLQAVRAMNRADLFFLPDKGASKDGLAALRRDILARHVTEKPYRTVRFAVPERGSPGSSYRATVAEWHGAIATEYRRLLYEEMHDGECAAFLVWGDPGLYDSVLRILNDVAKGRDDVAVEIVPGITSVQALTAAHRIPLNTIGNPVHITTGRRLAAGALPADADTVVVMLDGETAFRAVTDPDTWIYWGAYLGSPDEITIEGRLGDVADEIVAQREAARARHGWIMDIYLLRRPASRGNVPD